VAETKAPVEIGKVTVKSSFDDAPKKAAPKIVETALLAGLMGAKGLAGGEKIRKGQQGYMIDPTVESIAYDEAKATVSVTLKLAVVPMPKTDGAAVLTNSASVPKVNPKRLKDDAAAALQGAAEAGAAKLRKHLERLAGKG